MIPAQSTKLQTCQCSPCCKKKGADTRPPPAAGRPSASALVGPYPIDEDALRKLKRLHDDGVIDDDEFKRGKLEALGLAEKIASAGALSRLPEDMLRNVLSFLVLKQDGIAQRFLENVREMQREVFDLLESTDDDEDNENGDEHLSFALDLIRDGDVCAKKLREDIESSLAWWSVCKDFARIFRKMYPDLRLDIVNSCHPADHQNSPSSAVNLKWRRWMDEFNRLTSSLGKLVDRIYVICDDADRFRSELNDWETPHVHVLELMAPFDGLDFHKFPQRDQWHGN